MYVIRGMRYESDIAVAIIGRGVMLMMKQASPRLAGYLSFFFHFRPYTAAVPTYWFRRPPPAQAWALSLRFVNPTFCAMHSTWSSSIDRSQEDYDSLAASGVDATALTGLCCFGADVGARLVGLARKVDGMPSSVKSLGFEIWAACEVLYVKSRLGRAELTPCLGASWPWS